MTEIAQEVMTPKEAAQWFRRSASWLRHQQDLLRVGGTQTVPLFHVRVCRAYMLARMCGLSSEDVRRVQLAALAECCGLDAESVTQTAVGAIPQLDEVGMDDELSLDNPEGERNQA